ncbi:uncharacterized protein LOC144927318 isoform X3 [Branchiostoma floridae x Branchiostoma belcheri]
MPQPRDRERHRSGRENAPTERKKRPSGEREQENEQKDDRSSEKSKSSRETTDSNQSYQECMEKRVEELSQQLQEERAASRREKLTVARLQREVARNKSEGPMREKLMKDLDLERSRREETEQKLRDVTADNEQCKTRLQTLQNDMQHMEEQVQGMVQLKQKMDQLKRERGHLIDAYENQMDSIRTHVSNLELENDDLVKKVNNYESLSDVHLSSAEEEREKTVLLMQRLKSLEAENSALVLENENQREQYERCLDEVANQVVQALMAQKDLREECLKLRNRVYDLEQQNKQLSIMFERRTSRFSSDSILQQSAKRLRQRSFGGESKAETASLDSSNHSLPVQPQRFSPSPHSGLPVSQHQRATSYSPSTFVSSRKSGSMPNGSAGETSPHSSLSSMASDYSAHSSNHNSRNCRSTPPPPLIYSVQRHHPTYSRSHSDPSQQARQQFKEDKIIERINQLRAQVASNSNGLGESMLVPYTSKQDMRGSNEGIYSPGSSRKSGLFESEGQQNYTDYHPHNRLAVKCHPPQIRVQGSEGRGQSREGRGHSSGSYNDDTLSWDNYSPCISPTGKLTGAKLSNGSVFDEDDLGDDFQVVKPEDLYSPGSEGSGGMPSDNKVASSSPGIEKTATSHPGNENGHVTMVGAMNGEHGNRLINSHMLLPRPYSPGRGAKKKNSQPCAEISLGQELLWKRREDLEPSDKETAKKGQESEFYKKLHPEARQFLAQNGIDMSWEDNIHQKEREGTKGKKKEESKPPIANGLSELEKASVVKKQAAAKLMPEGGSHTYTKKDSQKRDAEQKTASAMVENSEQSHKPQSLLHSSPAFVKNRTSDPGRGRSPFPSMLSKAEHDGTSPSLPCKDSPVENGTGDGYRPVLVSNLVRRFQEMEKNEKKTNEVMQTSSQNSCRFNSSEGECSRSVEGGVRSPFKPRTEDNLSLKTLEDDLGTLSCEAEGASASNYARSPKHSPPVRDTPSNQSEASNGMLGGFPINQSQVGMEERDESPLVLHRNGSPLQKYHREPNWKNYAPEGFVNKAAKSSRSDFVVDGSETCVLNNENMEKGSKPEPVAFYQNRVPKPNYVNRQELYIDEDSIQCSAEGFTKTQTKTINANFSGLQGPRPFKTSLPVPKPYAGPPLQLNNLSTSNGTGAAGTQDKSQYNVTESETVPKSSLVASDQVPNSSKPFLKVRNETSSPQRCSRKDQELAFIHNELCIHEGTASLNSSTSDLELRTFQERLKLDLPDIATIKTDSGSSSDSSPEESTKPLSMGSLFAPASDFTQSDASEDITPTNATARRVGESGFVRSNSFTVLEDDHEKERSSPELDKCAELEGEFMLERCHMMGREDGGKEPSSPPAREGLSKSQESLLSGESLDLSLFEKREGQADLTLSTLLMDSDDEDGPLDEEPINFVERWKQRSNNSTPVRLPDWSPSKTKEELSRKVSKPSTALQLDLDRPSHQALSENWLLGMPTTNPTTSSQSSANSMFPTSNKNSSYHGNSGKLANGSPLQRRRWMDGFDETKGQRSKGVPRSSQTWERGCTARPSERSRDMWAGFSDGEIAELEEKDGHVRYRPIFKEGEKFPGFADEDPVEVGQRKGLYDSAYGTNGTDGRESSGEGISSLIGKDEVSEPESLSAKERANLLDSLIGSDDSTTDSEDEADHHLFTKLRLARRSVKRNQVIRDSQAGYVSIVEFRARNMFARFGEPEKEAVACFDFLEELSISSVDREEKDEDTRQHTPLQSDQDNSNIPNKADSPKSSKDDHNNKISGRNHSHPDEGEVEVDGGAERPGSSPASSTECLSFSDSLYDSFSSNPSLSSNDT